MSLSALEDEEPRFVPDLSLLVNDAPVDAETRRRVKSATFADSLDQIDIFTVTLENWDDDSRKFVFSDGEMFLPGNRLKLKMGYHDSEPLATMIDGVVTEVATVFPPSEAPFLVVRGQSVLAKLMKKQESHVYEEMTDSEIAEEIAGRLGVELKTSPSAAASETRHDYVIQVNLYDIVFLLERARRLGYDLFVEDIRDGVFVVYFGRTTSVSGEPVALKYGRDLNGFEVTLDTSRQVESVTVRAWDNVKKAPIVGTAKRAQSSTLGGSMRKIDALVEKAIAGREEVVVDVPVASESDAEALAKGYMDDIVQAMVSARGCSFGRADIRSGVILDLEGLGARYSGRYFVTASEHTIDDNGYRTDFVCRREG